MRPAAACALVALFVVACSPGNSSGVASTARTTAPPSQVASSTKLNCGDTHIGASALAVYRFGGTSPFVDILDMSNPLKPSLVCTLMPAEGAHLLSDTKLAFWIGDQLGTADLGSGGVITTARLAGRAGTSAFSADATKFAYRVFDDVGGMSTHLYVNGSDLTLYTQEPLGGHGGPGPSFGPVDQLEFSADGSLLLDFFSFRPQSGPANFIVFKSNGPILFQSSTATGGAWSPVGNTLYFFSYTQPGPVGELDSLTADGQRHVVAAGVKGMFWPRMSPDGRSIVYNTSDASIPDCGGVPHLWRIDLTTGVATQISNAISSTPFFVQRSVVWSDEQQVGQCGPGGPSAPDGVTLAHDLNTGQDAIVDTTLIVPGIGGPPLPGTSTLNLLDAWFAPT